QPPKVEINVNSLALEGNPGDELAASLEVKTPDKKPVHAYAVGDQPWLEPGVAKLSGRTATLPVKVRVPDKPGETLTGALTVTSTGGKRFRVAVTLKVGGTPLEILPSDGEGVVELPAAAAASPFEAMLEPEPAAAGVAGAVAAGETFADLNTAATAVLP